MSGPGCHRWMPYRRPWAEIASLRTSRIGPKMFLRQTVRGWRKWQTLWT